MKPSTCILLLFFIYATTACAQDTTAWMRTLNGNGSAAEKCIASQHLGKFYLQEQPYYKGIIYAENGLPFAKQTGNDSLLWVQYGLLGDLYDEDGSYEQAINNFKQALAIKQKQKNLLQMAHTYNSLGILYGKQNNYTLQAEYYIKAQKIYEAQGDINDALRVSGSLARLLGAQGDYEGSIKTYRTLLPKFEKAGLPRELYRAYCNIANYFANLNMPDSVLKYSALEISAAHRSDNKADDVYDAWTRNAVYCGYLGHTPKYKVAIDSIMYYAKQVKNSTAQTNAYKALAYYHITVTKDFKQVISALQQSINLDSARNAREQLYVDYQHMASAYQGLKDYKTSNDYLWKAYYYRDTLVSTTSRTKILEMQARYGAEKKEAQIALLDNENKLQKRTSWFLVGGLGLVALIGFILYRNNRAKQRINRKLQTLNAALDEANQSKAKLFSILSHDLRSPVSDLFTFLELQKMAPDLMDEAKKKAKQEQLYNSTDHLLNTMTDLLLWSKSQQQSFAPDKTDVDLKRLIENTVAIHSSPIADKQLTVDIAVEDEIVHTDENMLKTIVRNLLNNAVKFTPAGGTIRFAGNKEAGKLQLHVINSGEPIKDDVAKELFNWSSVNSNSHGYGLKLAGELAERLNINISAASGFKGNVFTITF